MTHITRSSRMRLRPFAVITLLVTGLWACGPVQVEPQTMPAAQLDTSLVQDVSPDTGTDDPNAVLQLPVEPITIQQANVTVLPPVTIKAVAHYFDGDAWYVQLSLPKKISEKGLFNSYEKPQPRKSWQSAPKHHFERLTLCDWSTINGRAAFLTPQEFLPTENNKPADLFLRVDGMDELKKDDSLTLKVRGCDLQAYTLMTSVKAGAVREIQVDMSGAKTGKKTLRQNFRLGIAKWFSFMTTQEAFSNFTTFAYHRLTTLAGEKQVEGATSERQVRNENELKEMMDFYTGHSSVRAAMAMAMDNGIGMVPAKEYKKVTLASIEGVTHQSRNYRELLAAAGKTSSQLDPLSQYLPADTLIATFSSLGEFARLTRILDQKLGDIARMVESAPGPFQLKKRYGAQLGMEFSGMAEMLGDLAAGTTAVVLGDPYLREGTDASLVFLNKNASLLMQALATHAQKSGKRHGGINTEELEIAGFTVQHITSTDHVVSRFQIQLKEVTFVSNSRGGMNRLLQVYKEKHPSMAQSLDYKYARGIVPWSASEESGFVYVGDALVAALTSPHAKIAESRRMRERERLMAVNYAALLFGWMKGRQPKSQAELLSSPWLTKKDLRHHDGRPITWFPSGGAQSAWGTASQLTPVIDMDFKKVSEAERDAYIAFRDRYNDSWSGRLDPALLRVKRISGTDDLDMRVHILPLSPNGNFADSYRKIREVAGDTRVIPAGGIHGATATLALGRNSVLKSLSRNYVGMFIGHNLDLGLFGNWVEMGIWESARFQKMVRKLPMFRYGVETQESSTPDNTGFPEHSTYRVIVPHLPLFVGIEVGNPLVFAGILAMARSALLKVGDGLVVWEPDEPYKNTAITRISVEPNNWTGRVPMELHYAMESGVLYMSLQRDVLEAQIDRAHNGQLPDTVHPGHEPAAGKQSEAAQFVSVASLVQEGWMLEAASEISIAFGFASHQRAVFAATILERGFGVADLEQTKRETAAIEVLGYYPQSPIGEEFTLDKNGVVTHPTLGSQLSPRRPSSFRQTPIGSALRSILSGLFTVSTYDRGGETELIATGKIRFRE